jgi:acyl-CoA dehydrogenase
MTQRVARILQQQGDQRDRLTEGIYMPTNENDAFAKLEMAYRASLAADKVAARIKDAIRKGELPRRAPISLVDEAMEKGIINENDVAIVTRAEELRTDAITVDSFSESEYLATALDGGW